MKRILSAAVGLALVLGTGGTASASDPHSSCSGLVASSLAGDAGARAAIQSDLIAEASFLGLSPGAIVSEFSRFHQESAEVCAE